MENLNSLETSVLIDLLAQHTEKYTNLMSQGCENSEYEKCKLTIETIQKEIQARQQAYEDNATASAQPPDFVL